MIEIKNLRILVIQLIISYWLIGCGSPEVRNGTIKINEDRVKVGMSLERNEKYIDVILFTLNNNTVDTIFTTPIATNYNRIILKYGNGEKDTVFSWKSFPDFVKINPDEEKVWRLSVPYILDDFSSQEDVQIFWNFEGIESDPIIISK